MRIVGVERERGPEVDLVSRREGEAFTHDAHDGIALGVEKNLAAEDARVRSELTLPESMAQEHHLVASRLSLLDGERAAERGLRAEKGKELGYGPDGGELQRLRFRPESVLHRAIGGHLRHRMRLLAPVEVGRRRDEIEAALGLPLREHDEPVGFPVRKGVQEDALHEAEDRGVRPDPEDESQEGHERQDRLAREGTEGEAELFPEIHLKLTTARRIPRGKV